MNQNPQNAIRVDDLHGNRLIRPQSRAGVALTAAACLLALAAFPQLAQAATTVSGAVSGMWTQTGSPYLVAGDILIPKNMSLVIQSNVQVNFEGPHVFEVAGVLQATGTRDKPIVFARTYTSIGWEGIFFNGGSSNSFLTHCQIYGSVNSGIRIKNTTPAIRNCVIANNSTPPQGHGGGIYASTTAGKLVVSGCTITNNTADVGGGVSVEATAEVTGCVLTGNHARGGAGFYVQLWSPNMDATFRNCDVTGNASSYYGGGFYCSYDYSASTLHLYNCKITTNSAVTSTGGIYTEGTGSATLVNCTIVGNEKSGIGIGARASAEIENSIVYANSGEQAWGGFAFAFSDVQGGIQPGFGNISQAPLLDATTLMLLPGSGCIDSGHPSVTYNDTCFPPSLGEVRNDMGAFGGPGACGWLEKPEVIVQPSDETVPAGFETTFAVAATGAPPLSYQWYFNGQAISGATATNYTILGVMSADEGNYYVVVSNPADSATSAVAVLKVQVPHAATATASVVNGFVVGANLADGGFGYTNTPTVRVIGGGGSGAAALAVTSNGVVTAVNLLTPGKGYTNEPVIVIAPPFIQQPTMDIAALSLLSFTNLAVGTNYQLECVSGSLTPVGPPFTATSSTFTQMVAGTASATSYRLTATPAPIQAQATAEVVNGFVVAVTVTNGGSGYTTYPAVNITGGGGSNATAAVTGMTGGSIMTVEVTNPGGGYTRVPNVIIALPPSTSLWPENVTQMMDLYLENLSPYDSYQVEFHPPTTGGWSDLGTPFTPTSATSTQTIPVSGNAGLFRVRYVQ